MKAKYDTIGQHYNQTRKADHYLTERLFQNLEPKTGNLYLDIGCGTGNYTDALQKRGVNFIGIDPSARMLEKAKLKNKDIDWRIGTAEQTGLEVNSIDGIIGSLTIHHWVNINDAFQELHRVLKTKGNIVILPQVRIR
jgi:ubiquinone/menaquinone biosynthesis C-methylase UbiE